MTLTQSGEKNVSKIQSRSSDYPKHTILKQVLKLFLTFYGYDRFKSIAYLFPNNVHWVL